MRAPFGGLLLDPHQENADASTSVFALLIMRLGKLVTGKFTRIWEYHSFTTTTDL
jgi:hypothetical protein